MFTRHPPLGLYFAKPSIHVTRHRHRLLVLMWWIFDGQGTVRPKVRVGPRVNKPREASFVIFLQGIRWSWGHKISGLCIQWGWAGGLKWEIVWPYVWANPSGWCFSSWCLYFPQRTNYYKTMTKKHQSLHMSRTRAGTTSINQLRQVSVIFSFKVTVPTIQLSPK
jgi:hypothetical protein